MPLKTSVLAYPALPIRVVKGRAITPSMGDRNLIETDFLLRWLTCVISPRPPPPPRPISCYNKLYMT